MNSALLAKVLTLSAALAIALTPGCRRKPIGITALPEGARTEGAGIANPEAGILDNVGGLGPGGRVQGSDIQPDTNIALPNEPLPRGEYNEDRTQFAANMVYFDFDSAVIKSTERGKITAVADYLRSTPGGIAVEIEGHCDERGTEEYNRSLGERRALAIREELALQGIDPRRVYTISYGEDRPAVDGHDEFAWEKNRRGEFVLLRPR
jgi:peptidoglycan-associated lipoprotein